MLKNMNPLTHSVITLSLHLISKMEYFGFRHFSDKKEYSISHDRDNGRSLENVEKIGKLLFIIYSLVVIEHTYIYLSS